MSTITKPSSKHRGYGACKASGIEWLGDVPQHWSCSPLKYVVGFINGAPFKPSDWQDDGVPIIRIENLNGGENFNYSVDQLPKKYHVVEGDLLFGWSGNRGTSFGPFLWRRAGLHYLNQHIFRLAGYDCDKEWLYWTLKAVIFYVERQAHGIIGLVHITKGDLGSIKIPLMQEPEQRAIAAFLDRETARIDALIEKKRRQIELLHEKRAALISHAVTKGLDPSAPMKDSGIDWLGPIPAHWSMKRLKFVSSLQTGLTLGKKYADEELVARPYLRVANVQDGYLDLETITEVELPAREARRFELESGDVLMTEGGDFDKLGRGYVWEGQIPGCLHQNHIFAVRPDTRVLNPNFLSAVLTSSHGKNYFTSTSQQTTNLASTNSTKLRSLPVPLPPLAEQGDILEWVARSAGREEAMMGKVNYSIDRLREYRTALISAAVTGKVDVRQEIA
ncbi:MAG TPA: restriction endonuclease subunit S [Candidatus Krumholzibacteria bacterium]